MLAERLLTSSGYDTDKEVRAPGLLRLWPGDQCSLNMHVFEPCLACMAPLLFFSFLFFFFSLFFFFFPFFLVAKPSLACAPPCLPLSHASLVLSLSLSLSPPSLLKQVRTLELLKLRFGEQPLHACEVMSQGHSRRASASIPTSAKPSSPRKARQQQQQQQQQQHQHQHQQQQQQQHQHHQQRGTSGRGVGRGGVTLVRAHAFLLYQGPPPEPQGPPGCTIRRGKGGEGPTGEG